MKIKIGLPYIVNYGGIETTATPLHHEKNDLEWWQCKFICPFTQHEKISYFLYSDFKK